MSPMYWDEVAGDWVEIAEDVVADDGYYGNDLGVSASDDVGPEPGIWYGTSPGATPYQGGPEPVVGTTRVGPQGDPGVGMVWSWDASRNQWVALDAGVQKPMGSAGIGKMWYFDERSKSWIAVPDPMNGGQPLPISGGGMVMGGGSLPGGAGGHATMPSGGWLGSQGVTGRLVVQNVASDNELAVLNYIRATRGARGMSLGQVQEALNNPSFLTEIANQLGVNVGVVQNVAGKVLSTGVSGLLMALTGNFPLAAMGYFASDRALSGQPSIPFQGWPGGAWADGTLVLPMGMPVPQGLPNEIFNDFRFVCYDRLSQRWWPTDEIRPLSYDGGNYRWLCLDRVEGKLYKCNWIKKPTVYV